MRSSPNSCTSSAPNEDTPTSDTQTGMSTIGLDLGEPLGPLLELPVVPVEGKAVHGDRVDRVEDSLVAHAAEEERVDRRHAPEDARQCWTLGTHRGACELHDAR